MVRDEGIGIAPNERDYIFAERYRGLAADKMGAVGGGIGLPYARQIMRLYGGDLRLADLLQPGEGRGAKFVVQMRR